MSTFAKSIRHLQREVTPAAAACNTDRETYVDPELLAAGVVQIPDDVHEQFARYGDLADKRLTANQRRRYLQSVRQAASALRKLYEDRQRQRKSWENRDTGARGCFTCQEYWLDPEPDPNAPVEIFGPVYGGNMTPHVPRLKFGRKRTA